MKPLGLQVTERPKGGFETRAPTMPGFDYRLRGATVLSGERHGRQVTVASAATKKPASARSSSRCQARVERPLARRAARSRRRRSEAIVSTLRKLKNSTRWNHLQVEAGAEGIVVSRKKAGQGDWLCDLWLAERLAAA